MRDKNYRILELKLLGFIQSLESKGPSIANDGCYDYKVSLNHFYQRGPMKKFILAFVLLCATPAFAGKMKEIYIMTQESVMDYLGFDESVIQIEGMGFVKVEGADLAVETIARSFYSRQAPAPYFKCITTYKKNANDRFSVVNTKCEEIYK